MEEQIMLDVEVSIKPRLRVSEKDCPKCHFVIMKNEKEDCYECMNCGYIDCGLEDE